MPSHREKKRYIALRVYPNRKSYKELAKHLKEELLSLLGVWDSAKAGIIVMPMDKGIIIRVTTKQLDKVLAAMALINLGHTRIDPVHISGTLRKAKLMEV